ncbi:MAG: radical SAM protein [Rhodospirillaceae bacterium]|jgi:MoaA/NifB/PqqE/SkfB family radical SAM enzyme|nr:radical SAM protein [Rhodospirillaceae bacterium]MBT3931408.1 radical SAM protein [Rhodospirillaceae bacterium]MBT4771568.1 radical SAM protein [Rhodospirillaceae bacterium]MBT5356869.1 radical SAM protein [Rhodospirillaceae bacterium]MBT5770727.1 radical SAM protein [Rhodospirillaceae bacterium]
MRKTRWSFDIDIVGRCNLSCPSCPVGNMTGMQLQSGYMSPEFLDKVLAKALSECHVTNVALYNWTEPFIHPHLPEMVRVVKSHGVGCGLSTNLNLGKQIEAVVAAGPDQIKISLSGFSQETYGITHRGGDIELVKDNMIRLSEAKKASKSNTRIIVAFHRYLHNQEDEREMRAFAQSLDFDFTTYWAYLMPLEKNLAYLGHEDVSADLNEGDRSLIDRLALPLDQAIEVSRAAPARDCQLRERQMAINSEGNVMLCCTVFDQSRYTLAPFLETSLEDLQAMKYGHSMCDTCMNEGLHVLMTYGDDGLDQLALDRVASENPGQNFDDIYVNDPAPKGGLVKTLKRAGRALGRGKTASAK